MKAPFPYFGGKSKVADVVWSALGACGHYIEPFCGSCAVLLARPGYDPAQHVETVNDADGMIANVWRSLQLNPEETARWCDWPVNHADLIARKKRLNMEYDSLLEKLCADDGYCDPKLAGYYIWAASCWIGAGLVCPGQRPHLAGGGKGVHAKGKIPHLAGGGNGVHAKGKIPHLAGGGNGVHAKGKIPHLAGGGNGVQEPYNLNIYQWFRELSERLRHVRVVCGDWKRVCGGNWQTKPGRPCGIFFDPPYSDKAERDSRLYTVDSEDVAHDVRAWCLTRANDPDYRIVLAGYYEEHDELLEQGWSAYKWSAGGGYSSNAQSTSQGQINRHKECLFLSPHCVRKMQDAEKKQYNLFPDLLPEVPVDGDSKKTDDLPSLWQ